MDMMSTKLVYNVDIDEAIRKEKFGDIWIILTSLEIWGCARSSDFVKHSSERQILCSVVFHALTLQLPIQTLQSVTPELQFFVSSLENCQNFSKTSTPLSNYIMSSNTWTLKLKFTDLMTPVCKNYVFRYMEDDRKAVKLLKTSRSNRDVVLQKHT